MDYLKIAPGIEEYTQSSFLLQLRKCIEQFPETDFSHSMSRQQIKSKSWLIENMKQVFGLNYDNIFVLCGWYGILPAMINDQNDLMFKSIRSIDIDTSCEKIADTMNFELYKQKWKFKAFTADILKLQYDQITLFSTDESKKISETPDLIINTSCEHIEDFETWRNLLPPGMKVIFQSNNFDLHAQHTNCSDSLSDFREQCNLGQVLFENTLSFDDYDRYMIMGIV